MEIAESPSVGNAWRLGFFVIVEPQGSCVLGHCEPETCERWSRCVFNVDYPPRLLGE